MKRKKVNEEESYFLKDEVLKKINDDEFGHRNFAFVLKEIIDKQKSPLNIGIFGKWGVGKSSIVSLYKELINKKLVTTEKHANYSKRIAFIDIPVWKYTQKESLRKKFIFKIAEGLYYPIDDLKEDIYGTKTITYPLLAKYFIDQLKKRKNIPFGLIIISLLIIVSLSILLHVSKVIDISSILQTIISYVILTGALLTPIITWLYTSLKTAKLQISYSKYDSDEQFENKFREIVGEKKCKKIIFIDDLDRCSINKVVETLETIKTFLDIQTCIFIIACDNKIIEQAIDASNSIYEEYEENNGTQYLEKFFQYTITIPPFIRQDMREYSKLILEKQKSKLRKLNDIDDILYVLIHENVINPRKAIVLINSFVSDYLVVKERENEPKSKLNIGIITKHLPALAKITVLKHDYPEFYSDLEKNKDLIKWLTAYINDEEELLEPYQSEKCNPYLLRKIISEEDEKEEFINLKENWDQSFWVEPKERKLFYLYNFLSSTREYDVDITDIRPFLFLGQDSASYGMADEHLEKIKVALIKGTTSLIKNMLESEKAEHKTKISNIMLKWIEDELSGPELRKSLEVLSECLYVMSENIIPHAAHVLIDKTLRSGMKERLKKLNVDGMFLASSKVKKQAPKVMKKYIENLNYDDINFSKKILDNMFIYDSLINSTEQIKTVKSFLEKREQQGE